MSASREKQKRQGRAGPYTKKESGKATKVVTILVVAAVVIGIIAMVINSTGILYRNATAVTVGDTKYTVGQAQFYYYTAYNQYLNMYGQYASMFGLDTSKPLDSQMYDDEQTWADYFRETALTNMQQVTILSNEAHKANFELTNEDREYIEETRTSIMQYCVEYNITQSTYFAYYGNCVTEALYFEELERSLLAESYSAHLTDQMEYTDDEINTYYEENKDDFDVVDYRYFLINGTPETETDENGETIEATEEETQAAMEAAKEQADAMAERLENGEDFTALTQEYAEEEDKETYADAAASTATEASKSSLSSSPYVDWLFEADRAQGDVTVVEATEGYYVIQFENRQRNEYATMNIRQILITPETMEGVDTSTEDQNAAAKEKAEGILEEWQAGEATEESFAELARQYSEDEDTKENGGLYEKLYKSTGSDLENWVFDSQRQAGDTTVVETSEGYHVVYIIGQDEAYWKLQVEEAMKTEEYNDWYETQQESYPMTTEEYGMRYVK